MKIKKFEKIMKIEAWENFENRNFLEISTTKKFRKF